MALRCAEVEGGGGSVEGVAAGRVAGRSATAAHTLPSFSPPLAAQPYTGGHQHPAPPRNAGRSELAILARRSLRVRFASLLRALPSRHLVHARIAHCASPG